MTHHARSRTAFFNLFCAAALMAMIPGTSSWATEPGNECWSSDYFLPGVTGYIYSMTSRPEGVYICGSITGLGHYEARGIALVSEVDGVHEVQVFGDGLASSWGKPVFFEGRLTVSGRMGPTDADMVYGAYANDGSAWSRLGTGSLVAQDLAVFRDELFMVGYIYSPTLYDPSTVWKWTGSDWIPWFVTDGIPGQVVEHDDLLYVAGAFASVNGDSVANIFAWDGVNILPLDNGFPAPVSGMITQGGSLVVMGNVGKNGGLVSRWNGSDWTVMLDVGRRVESLTDWGGQLVAATDSLYDNSFATVHNPDIVVHDNGRWISVTKFQTRAVAAHGTSLFIQNPDFHGMAGDLVSPNLVVYRNDAMSAPFPEGMGFQEDRMSLALVGDQLIIGGEFKYGAGMIMRGAGAYDGLSWAALDSFDLNLAPYKEPEGFLDIVSIGNDLFGLYRIHNLDYSSYSLLKRDPDPPANGAWKILPGGWYASTERLQPVGSRLFTWLDSGVWEIDPETGANSSIAELNVDGSILATCSVDSQLVIAGGFQSLNGSPSSNILRYDGVGWADFAPALPGPVVVITELPGHGFAAAYLAGSDYRVALLDGQSWEYLMGDFDGPIQALTWHQDRLVAAGYFSFVGSLEARGIAVWTGSSWGRLGSGLSQWVRYARIVDMVSTSHGLYVSGGMMTAGEHRSSGLALWTGVLRLITGVSPVPDDVVRAADPFRLHAVPNPFNPRSVISWNIPSAGFVRLTVLDLRGRRVRTLLAENRAAGPIEVVWDGHLDSGRPAASGLYHLRMEWNGQTASRKLTLVR
ncbi:MAG: FlgD immunoglobulin-like domain containing protein [bacterium]